jgi:hypothetical protein
MSANLQEMENVVKKGAAAGDPMVAGGAQVEDLGGPTPENYRPDDDSAKLKDPGASLGKAPVPTAQGATAKEEVETEEETIEEVNVEEDVAALFAGEELSEEFQEKAKTVFEAAVHMRVEQAKAKIAEEAEAALAEQLEGMKSELVERVDAYLEYVAQEWVEENALQIEQGLKTEMTESFLEGMKSLFEDHYVSIPEDKYDVVENMVEKLDDMETKLNEQIERNIQLNRRLGETTAEGIFASVSEGLALTQKEKLASLAEGVEFEGEESYREKLTTLRESYFPTEGVVADTSETLSEGVGSGPDYSGSMSRYLDTLSRIK